MHFNVALFSSLLLVPAVLVIPSALGARIARRREGRQSQLNSHIEQAAGSVFNTAYSKNWAGAVWAEGVVSNIFHRLFCDRHRSHPCLVLFNRELSPLSPGPSPSPPHRIRPVLPPPPGLASMMTFVQVLSSRQVTTSPSKAVSPNMIVRRHLTTHSPLVSPFLSRTAWYEWYPAPTYDFSGITISAGDVIKLTVTASPTTSGNATIENVTNGRTVSKGLTSNAHLCGQNAEWIVEDYMQGNSMIPFANVNTVAFTDAEAGPIPRLAPSSEISCVCTPSIPPKCHITVCESYLHSSAESRAGVSPSVQPLVR